MAFTKVNDTGVSYSTSGGTFTIPATTIGNVLALSIANFTGAGSPTSISSVSGGGVGTWIKAIAANNGGSNNYESEIWYGVVTSGTSNTSVTVVSTIPGVPAGNITEFSWSGGAATAVTVEAGTAGANSHNAVGTGITSGVVSPTAGRDAIIYVVWGRNGTGTTKTSGPTNSFTELTGFNGNHTSAFLLASSTTGTYSVSWVYSNNYAGHNAVIAVMSIGGSSPTVNSGFFNFFLHR